MPCSALLRSAVTTALTTTVTTAVETTIMEMEGRTDGRTEEEAAAAAEREEIPLPFHGNNLNSPSVAAAVVRVRPSVS